MNKLHQTKELDLEDLRFMKQMIINADRQLLFHEIDANEHQYILSRVIANIELLEVKYGMD